MITGQARLRLKFGRVIESIKDEVVDQIDKEANILVNEIDAAKWPTTTSEFGNEIEVGSTWGDVPRGAITTRSNGRSTFDVIRKRVWARAPSESGWDARWFEFGTKPRFTKTGKFTGIMPVLSFFWPTYRKRRKNMRSNITRAVRRGVRKVQ